MIKASDFGQLTLAKKIHEGVGLPTKFLEHSLLGCPGLLKKKLGFGGLSPNGTQDPPNALIDGSGRDFPSFEQVWVSLFG